jgi:type I restriction enzyme S subunit
VSLIERTGSRFPFAPLQAFAESGRSAIVDGPFGSDLTTADYREEGIPLIQLNNVIPGKHIPRDLKFIETPKAARLARHTALPGDIVIAKMADPVARAAQVAPAFPEYCVVADCVRFRPDYVKCDARFVVYAMNSSAVFAQADALCAGTTRQRISLGEIRKLRLPSPPLPTQKKKPSPTTSTRRPPPSTP